MEQMNAKAKPWMACVFMLSIGCISTLLAIWGLSLIGLTELLPLKESLLLTSLLALILGYSKHSIILNTNHSTKHAFFVGISLFLLLLPFFDIGALFMMKNQFNGTDNFHAAWSEYFTLYFFILIYSFIFIGSWLSIISGVLFVAFNRYIKRQIILN
jgi:uncharacterized membrane protein